ncbi:MAG TPA: DUF3500 domain-containing protein [Roseimicrobium sp.]|nr:DUF3500 domain-containing protein [Roseimicrobium sp.]
MQSRHLIRLTLCLGLSLAILPLRAADVVSKEMTDAARNFLTALTPDQKAKATYELKADERLNWHFIPKPRNGLPLKEMTIAQRHLAMALLGTGMSSKGQAKALTIMSLEQILHDMENKSPKRDPELYYVTIFGTPDEKAPWGWRVEGHHLSLNFTVGGDDTASTPSFMGTNPGEVREGQRKGVRVLGYEEELGRTLVKSLNAEQKKAAIYSETAPKDVITAAERTVKALEAVGVSYSKLNKEQQSNVEAIINEYIHRVRPEIAAKDLAKIKASGMDKILFAWAGSMERGQGHYYRVQGPTFLLEYDNTQNDANHVHAVWRDFDGDFGTDLLKKHYASEKH